MGKELRVKGIYSSGMVLQRDKINCIYGTGDVFSDVIMSFRGVTSITQVDETGNWKFEFSPGEAGGPFVMSIKSGADKIEFKDIYVGEVWLNAGEGNAQLSMGRMKYTYPEEFNLPENKNVRMINVPTNFSFGEKIDYIDKPLWQPVAPYSIGDMSGLGYFFGKKLSVDLGVPVGIINISREDIPIVSWISKKGLEEMGDKQKDLDVVSFYENAGNVFQSELKVDELAGWNSELMKTFADVDFNSDEGWSDCSIPGTIDDIENNGVVWLKKEIELSDAQINHFRKFKAMLWLGLGTCADEVFFNGTRIGFTKNVNRARRFEVNSELLKAGKNIILVKLIKNCDVIRCYKDKPYCLFSGDVYVAPGVSRNIGVRGQSLAPVDGEYISLEGQWKFKAGAVNSKVPPKADLLEAKPTAIYNGVLPACFKYAIAGVIWYQGESDVLGGRAAEYKGLLTKLISVWRRRFTYWSRDLPFVIVQLPNWANGGEEGELSVNSDLAVVRKAQADVSELIDRVGLVVSIDAGEWNDLYPEKKSTIGFRCAFEALRVAYGKSFISPAPKANFCDMEPHKYTVKFDCGNSSLQCFKVSGMAADLSKESDDGVVYGFSFLYKDGDGKLNVAGASGKIVKPNGVEVTVPDCCCEKGCEIVELRYLWGNSPAPVNLYSRDMIPAGPFVIPAK